MKTLEETCDKCQYKYSCGESKIDYPTEGYECVSTDIFKKSYNNMYWSRKYQKLVKEKYINKGG